jgi:hypothetical protein
MAETTLVPSSFAHDDNSVNPIIIVPSFVGGMLVLSVLCSVAHFSIAFFKFKKRLQTGEDKRDVEDGVVAGRFRSIIHSLMTGNNYYSLFFRSNVTDASVTRARRIMLIMSITTTIFGLNSIYIWMDTQGNILPSTNVFVIAFITSFLAHYFNQIFVYLYGIIRPFDIFTDRLFAKKKTVELELGDRLVSPFGPESPTSKALISPISTTTPDFPKSYLERKDVYTRSRWNFKVGGSPREEELKYETATRKPFSMQTYPWQYVTREGRIRVQKYSYYSHEEMIDEAKRDIEKHIELHKEANFEEHPNLWTNFDGDSDSDVEETGGAAMCNLSHDQVQRAVKRITLRLEQRKKLRDKRESYCLSQVKNPLARFRLDMRSFIDDLDDKVDRFERNQLKGCCLSVARATGDRLWFLLLLLIFTISYVAVCVVPVVLWGVFFVQYTWHNYMLGGMISAFMVGYVVLLVALHYRMKFSVYNNEQNKSWNNLNIPRILTGIALVVVGAVAIIVPLVLYFTTTVFKDSDVTYFAFTLVGVIVISLCVSAYYALSWKAPPRKVGSEAPLPWWCVIPVDAMVLANVGSWVGCTAAFSIAFSSTSINAYWAYNSLITIIVDVFLFETIFMPIMRLISHLTLTPALKSFQYTE